MRLVVDANVLVAAFLKSSVTRDLLLDERLAPLAPEHLLIEARKVLLQRRILRRLSVASAQIEEMLGLLTGRFQIFPEEAYGGRHAEARALAPHVEDMPYLALALLEDAPIWSNDALLKEQSRVRIYTTRELLAHLSR